MQTALAGQFLILSAHDRLLQAHSTGVMHAVTELAKAGDEERWNVHVWADGRLSLQNEKSRLWLSAEPSGRAICNRQEAAEWEKWTLHAAGDLFHIGLKSTHGKWLCAQPPGQETRYGGEVAADRDTCAEWERFSILPSQHGQLHDPIWWEAVGNAVGGATALKPIVVE